MFVRVCFDHGLLLQSLLFLCRLPVHFVPLRKREILSIDLCPKLAKYNLNDYVFKAATQSFVPQSESFQYLLV